MGDHKIVIGTKEGKCLQRDLTDQEFDSLHRKVIGETISGETLGYTGYEFVITGGSDKCGFPMRKGIQLPRKKILIGAGVGFIGKKRRLRKKPKRKKQLGLLRRRTVSGEMITKIIHQVNMKAIKEGPQPLVAESKPEA